MTYPINISDFTRRPRWQRWAGPVRYLARRCAHGALTLLLVSLIVFAAVQLLPGDAATAILGKEATPERLTALREQLGLGATAPQQYATWLVGTLQGDLGSSAAARIPVTELLADRFENTGLLLIGATLVAVPLGLAMGIGSALRRDRLSDHAVSVVTLILHSLPEFVIALTLVLVFSTQVFHVLPAVSLVPPGASALDDPAVLVLPVLTLAATTFPYIARTVRSSMIEALESEYVDLARLHGLPERTVVLRHALPNALVPAIQVVALQVAWMAGGVVVVEFVFGLPGLGAALVEAVRSRDLPVVQATALLAAAIYVVMGLLADVATTLASPRLRTAVA